MALAAADLQQTENGLSQWREPPAEVGIETLKTRSTVLPPRLQSIHLKAAGDDLNPLVNHSHSYQ